MPADTEPYTPKNIFLTGGAGMEGVVLSDVAVMVVSKQLIASSANVVVS
jgi:hypothetical protein